MPLSCCRIPNGVVGNFSCTVLNEDINRYSLGCLSEFSNYIAAHAVSLGAAGVVIAVIQVCFFLLISVHSLTLCHHFSSLVFYLPATLPEKLRFVMALLVSRVKFSLTFTTTVALWNYLVIFFLFLFFFFLSFIKVLFFFNLFMTMYCKIFL